MQWTDPSANELAEALEAQRTAFRRRPYPSWDERAAWLKALRDLILANQETICDAIHADFGCRPVEETRMLEMFPSLKEIAYNLRHGHRWMRTRRRAASLWFLPARTELVPQPVGVVGVIVPSNYPLYLAMGPISDALAAGNRVMVKMSEHTPSFSALFARLVEEYFPGGELSVVNGGVDVGRAFSSLPLDHLLFTGATGIGREVMQAAAKNLTPVTLELGGKSPAIIGPGARFEHAVERILYGKCVNAGQTCVAPDYVLLPRDRQQAFIDTARAIARRMYPDLASGQYASIITERQYQRLVEWRDEAVREGARAHVLSTSGSDAARIMAPTLLTDVNIDSTVMREEIFGPLLPLVPYDDLDQALDYMSRFPHPLALYLFEEDRAIQRRVLQRQLAGGVTINDTLYHLVQNHLPFGGIGQSGMGAIHGETGFRTFSKMKPVFRQARFNGVGLFNPPYGARFRRMVKLLLGG